MLFVKNEKSHFIAFRSELSNLGRWGQINRKGKIRNMIWKYGVLSKDINCQSFVLITLGEKYQKGAG